MFSGQPKEQQQKHASKHPPAKQPAQQVQQPQLPLGGQSQIQPLSPNPDVEPEATVRPNFLWAAAYFFLYIVAIIGALAISFFIIKYVFDIDLFLTVKEALGYITAGSNSGSSLIELLFHEMETTIMLVFVQIVVFVLILQIPLVNKQWKLFHTYLEYKEGFLVVKKERLSYLDIATVSFERYISGLDFGKVIVEYSGKEGHTLEMPYVYPASMVTYVLNDLAKEHKAEIALKKKVEDEEKAKKAPIQGQAPQAQK